jgi:hypothetical protein
VNELSGTIDLESTLIRAESLYRRFQRTVETIDKKHNFPAAPSARQRRSISSPPTSPGPSESRPQAAASGTDRGKQSVAEENATVISPELRVLLRREIERLDKKPEGSETK